MTHILPFLLVPLVAVAVYFAIQKFKATKAKGDVPPVNLALSLSPDLWVIGPIISGKNYSVGMPLHPSAEAGGSWSFTFPTSDGVHYVDTGGSVAGKSCVSMTYEVVADAVVKFVPTQGDGPGHVRLYFQRADDDWQRVDGRWWSAPVDLAPGTFTLAVPLTPDKWTNVNGMPGTQPDAGFAAALSASGVVGMTFGGMFAGHGLFTSGGPAKFILREYKIT